MTACFQMPRQELKCCKSGPGPSEYFLLTAVGSRGTFIRSKQMRMAATISSSETGMTSSTRSLTIGHVRSPSRPEIGVQRPVQNSILYSQPLCLHCYINFHRESHLRRVNCSCNCKTIPVEGTSCARREPFECAALRLLQPVLECELAAPQAFDPSIAIGPACQSYGTWQLCWAHAIYQDKATRQMLKNWLEAGDQVFVARGDMKDPARTLQSIRDCNRLGTRYQAPRCSAASNISCIVAPCKKERLPNYHPYFKYRPSAMTPAYVHVRRRRYPVLWSISVGTPKNINP